MAKSVVCNYEGKSIRVINTLLKCSLFVDDKLIAENKDLFALDPSKPLLSALNYPFVSGAKNIDVFAESGMVSVKIKICVDGQKIGGDKF
jgi:hypothetical protein